MQIEGLENFNSKNRDLSTSIQATIKNVLEFLNNKIIYF